MSSGHANQGDARLEACTAHIVQRLANAALEDMRARYDLGCLLLGLRERPRTETTAGRLHRLAERLGVDPSALRRYAHVSATIVPREFEWLIRLRTTHGEPLSWSHIEVLARAKDAEQRRELGKTVVTEGLSVRALCMRLRTDT